MLARKVIQGEFHCFRARLSWVSTLICDGGANTPLAPPWLLILIWFVFSLRHHRNLILHASFRKFTYAVVFFSLDLFGCLFTTLSIPSKAQMSKISRLVSTSDILKNRWRVSMNTWFMGIKENMGSFTQLYRYLLFLVNLIFLLFLL